MEGEDQASPEEVIPARLGEVWEEEVQDRGSVWFNQAEVRLVLSTGERRFGDKEGAWLCGALQLLHAHRTPLFLPFCTRFLPTSTQSKEGFLEKSLQSGDMLTIILNYVKLRTSGSENF